MHRRHALISITITILLLSIATNAQTPADSIAIHDTANWHTLHRDSTCTISQAQFSTLFGHPQSLTIAIASTQHLRPGIGISNTLRPTSDIAQSHNAAIAVNGSYFDMTKGNSSCFLKENKTVIDTTATYEANTRCNGAIRCTPCALEIMPWSPTIEHTYTDTIGTILVSGPLLLHRGLQQQPPQPASPFTTDTHPRTAVGLTADGNIIILAVDGRHPGHAHGMTIPQLTYLMRQLGCTHAINLDGGGSTTLWTAAHGTVSHPSDNATFDHHGQRPVPNILYLK